MAFDGKKSQVHAFSPFDFDDAEQKRVGPFAP